MAAPLKNIKIGKRERIVIGALSTLLCIAIAHFLLYRPKSIELSTINKDYEEAYNKYQEYASKNLPPKEIKTLEGDVKKLDDLLNVSIEKFQIGKEKELDMRGPTYMKILDEIKALEKNSSKTKINVLSGWTITDDIPGLESARIPDYLDQLKQKKAILSMPNIPLDLKENFDSQYREILQRLGFNKNELSKMNAFIAWLKQIRMFYYIKAHIGASDIKDAELFSILDIPIYDENVRRAGMFILMRTKELLDLAIQSKVDSISDVKLLGRKDIRPAVKETPTPKPAQGVIGEEGPEGSGPGGGPMRGGPGFRGPGGPGGGMFGMLNRLAATPTPTPKLEPPAAYSIPIELTITGDNLSVTKFLYAVTHSPRLMDIYEMDIVTQEEGKLTAKIAVNCYSDVKAVDDLQKIVKATPQPAKPNR